ncbi:MAG TPA: alpha/beta hydrolase [Chitinophagaceae bacterium]|nr:alpha/beta hydrolase [Chitinophagaceae bacterium]
MNSKSKFLIGFVFLILSACNDRNTKATATAPQKIAIENGGVKIDYFDSGAGDTALLFIHGWNINKEYWKDQTAKFSNGYRVVSLDLPGFGQSGKGRETWSVEEYGKDVTTVLNKLDLKNVVLIGHSMSGAIIIEAALKNPTRVIGVVGVDNFTNVGAEISPQLKKEIAEAYKAIRKNYKAVVLQYANESLFSPSTDSTVRKRVTNDFMNADSILAVNVLEQNDKYPVDENLKALKKPLYLINSSYHPTDTSGFRKYNIPFRLLYVGPTGHYPMIENPDEFNKKLEEVLRALGKVQITDKRALGLLSLEYLV